VVYVYSHKTDQATCIINFKSIYNPDQIIESVLMALSIKNAETETLIRRLALQERTSMVQAINIAVKDRLKGPERFSPEERARRIASIEAMQARVAAQNIDWSLTDDEILGYDENGLPN
jgi:antitoxin VapB